MMLMVEWGQLQPHLLYLHPHTFAQPRPTCDHVSRGNKKCWVGSKFLKSSICIYVYIYIYHIISYYIIYIYIIYYILYIIYYILYYLLYYIIPYYNICIYFMKYNIHIYIYNTTYIIYSATIINYIYNYSTLYRYRERERGRCLDVDRTEVGSHLCIFPRRSSYKGS